MAVREPLTQTVTSYGSKGTTVPVMAVGESLCPVMAVGETTVLSYGSGGEGGGVGLVSTVGGTTVLG